MAIERRPAGRPAPQKPSTQRVTPVSAPQKSPTQRVTPVSPQKQTATSRVSPVEAPRKSPTSRVPQRGTGRAGRAEGGATSRAIPVQKKNNTPLLIGAGIGGAVLLVIVIAVAASGGSKKAPAASNPRGPAPVDVGQLETQGMAKCEQGCEAIQRSYDAGDKAGLQRGINLITEGNAMLDRANQMSGNTYDTKKYNQTLKMARGKLLELK